MAQRAFPSEADIKAKLAKRAKRRRLAIGVVFVLFAVLAVQTWRSANSSKGKPTVGTMPVHVTSAKQSSDGVHVTASFTPPSTAAAHASSSADSDAASKPKSYEMQAVIPTSEWRVSQIVWVCYPPSDPNKGFLRSVLDSDCSTLATGN